MTMVVAATATAALERVRLKYALISLGGDLLRTAERNVLAVL